MTVLLALETALEAMQEAKQEIIGIEATNANRKELDEAYNGLRRAIESVNKLLNPTDE